MVEPAAKQREALALLEEQVFSDKPFQFPARAVQLPGVDALVSLGHATIPLRTDYPVHDVIAMWQDRILQQLLSPLTLDRLHDTELKVPADQDALTTAELLDRLTKAIFAEVDKMPEGEYTNRKPAISSLRRNLQRDYLKRLSELAMGRTRCSAGLPDDRLRRACRRSKAGSTTCSRATPSSTPTAAPTWKRPPAASTRCSTPG